MKRPLGVLLSALVCATQLSATGALAQRKADAAPATPAQAAPSALIQKGQEQFEDQQYEESIQTLSAALLRPDNTPAQKVEIYRLLALDYITLGRTDEAESAVRGLLVQAPDYQLPTSESPRFRDFFAQARAKWEAEGRPGIVVEAPPQKPVLVKHAAPAQAASGKSVELRARVEDDAGRTSRVTVHYRAGNKGPFTEADAKLNGGAVRALVPSSFVKPPLLDYYFEVLDDEGNVIATRGDASSPLRIAVPEPSSGWVLPLAIGGGIVGAAAIVGGLALAGVFKSDGAAGPRGTGTVNVSVTEAGFR